MKIKVDFIHWPKGKGRKIKKMTIEATAYGEGGRFAYHNLVTGKNEFDEKQYSITHIPSGKTVGTRKKSIKKVKSIIDQLLALKGLDWSKENVSETVSSDIKKEIMAIIK